MSKYVEHVVKHVTTVMLSFPHYNGKYFLNVTFRAVTGLPAWQWRIQGREIIRHPIMDQKIQKILQNHMLVPPLRRVLDPPLLDKEE